MLVVLYDGECGLCSRAVRVIIGRDRRAVFRFAALQSPRGLRECAAHGIVGRDTLVLIEDGRAWTRSTAVLRIARHLRWPWPLAYAAIAVPRPLRDLAYRTVAANRQRWSLASCRPPTADERARFLDDG